MRNNLRRGFQREQIAEAAERIGNTRSDAIVPSQDSGARSTVATARKLSFKEQRELDELPQRIAALEQRKRDLHDEMSRPGFYQSAGDVIASVAGNLAQVDAELSVALERWVQLEA